MKYSSSCTKIPLIVLPGLLSPRSRTTRSVLPGILSPRSRTYVFRTCGWPQYHVNPLVVGWCVSLFRSCSTILLRFTVMCTSTCCFLHTGRNAWWLGLLCLGGRARGGKLRPAQTWCSLLLVPLLLLPLAYVMRECFHRNKVSMVSVPETHRCTVTLFRCRAGTCTSHVVMDKHVSSVKRITVSNGFGEIRFLLDI